jgi:hypothetical protein
MQWIKEASRKMQWMQEQAFGDLCITNISHAKEPIKTSHEMTPKSYHHTNI